jgi:hypothetical protein
VRSSDLLIEDLLLGLSISNFTTPNVWWYLESGWRLLNRARTWARLKVGASPLPGVDRSSVLRAITGAFSHDAAIAHLRDSEVLLWRVVQVALSLHGVRCGWRDARRLRLDGGSARAVRAFLPHAHTVDMEVKSALRESLVERAEFSSTQCRCCRGLLQAMSTSTLLDELHNRAVSVFELESALDWLVTTYLRCMKQTIVRETRKLKDHRRTKSKIQLHGHLKALKGESKNCTRLCFR